MPLFWLLYTGILGYILLRFSGFFFFLIEGWVGGVYRIQIFFGFLYFFYIYKAPKSVIQQDMTKAAATQCVVI